jgi:Ni,Fe-hydrogenase III small subunit/ferredoxin
MSRWIALGLRTGVKTTGFPGQADPAAEAAPSAIQIHPAGLTAERALAAAATCPTDAIVGQGNWRSGSVSFDLGQCVMCGRCVAAAPEAFKFVSSAKVAVRDRDRLQARFAWRNGRVESQSVPSDELGQTARDLNVRSTRVFGRSLHIRHVDAGSCNGCESELQMLSSPNYDLAHLGLFFTPTPRHADALLVTGVVTRQMEKPLLVTYEAMPEPKLVVAAGVCAIGGGCFAGGFMTSGPLDRVLPVDVYVPGCPPTPLAVLHGLLLAVGKAEERYRSVGSADGS